MSPLEIVLISVLSGLTFVVVVYLIVLNTNKENRRQVFEILNEDFVADSIVFLGDSLTDFFPLQDFFPQYLIYNRGIAGDTTKGVLNRISNIIQLQPKKIFLQIGTNDLGKSGNYKKIYERIEDIVTILLKNIKGVDLHIISLYPVSHKKTFVSPLIAGRRSNKKLIEINKLLITLCERDNLKYIDVYNNLIDEKGKMKLEYTIEGLHISGLGYRVIAEIIRPYL